MLELDTIHINDLVCFAKIGITPEERSFTQRVNLSFKLSVSLEQSALTRNIEDTVCYVSVAKDVKSYVESKAWNLVEELSENIISLLLESYSKIECISITASKFCVPSTSAVGVTITRKRKT